MAVTIRIGESNKRHQIACSFDMSAGTAFSLVYSRGDGSTLSVTPTLGTSQATIDGLTAAANTWIYYDFEPGDLGVGEDGDWTADFTFTDTATTPDTNLKNLIPIELMVSP